jgi:hypothetical protein
MLFTPQPVAIGPLQEPPFTEIELPPLSENENVLPDMPLSPDLQISMTPDFGCTVALAAIAPIPGTIKNTAEQINQKRDFLPRKIPRTFCLLI